MDGLATYPCGDVMAVDCIAGADAGEAEGAVGVQAEGFFDDGVEVLEALEGVVVDVVVGSEGGADLAFEDLQFVRVCEEEVHRGGEKIGVRIEAPDDEVVGLRDEKPFGRNGLVVGDQEGEVIRVR